MRLNPPTVFVFLISLILVGAAVIAKLGIVSLPNFFPNQQFWMVVTGYAVLMIGNLVRGL